MLKKLLISIAGMLQCVAISAQTYKWDNVAIVAGGYIPGIVYHPTVKDVAYLRSDMGGAYRYNASASKWEPISDMWGQTDWTLLGIESIALDPTDANLVYMAAGTYTNDWSGNGAILKSNDKGTTWTRINMNFKFGGNEDGRPMGERLAVDPNNPNILFLGTRKNGMWRSSNKGNTWTQVSSFPITSSTSNGVGIGFVVFDKASGSTGNASQTIYAGISDNGTNLYKSTNGGQTWSAVSGAPTGVQPHQAIIASNRMMYFTYSDAPGPNGVTKGSVWKYNLTTSAWTEIRPSPASDQGGYSGLTVDATNPNIVMVGTICRWWPNDQIFRTTDGGSSWKACGTGTNITRDASPSPYLRWGAADDSGLKTGNWVSGIAIDPFNSNKVIYATGATVWGCDKISNVDNNQAITWQVKAAGIEQTAVLALASPNAGPSLLSGVGDVCGFVHTDITKSPAKGMIDPTYKNGEDVDFAELNPSKFVIIGHDYTPNYFGSYSTDAGVTWTKFSSIPSSAQDGTISLSANGNTIVWAPKNGAPSRSTNNGSSWTQVTGIGGSATVVSDRVNSSKFYGIMGSTLYRSTDGGVSFSAAATSGFAGTKLKAVPGVENNIWVPAYNGLYRSTNGGTSFTKVANVQVANAVGFGKAASGKTHPAVFITGTANNTVGIFRSDDEGATWIRVNDDLHQFGNANADITGDPRVFGRVYLAANGRGIIYGELSNVTALENEYFDSNSESVNCFPNPFTGTFTIRASGDFTYNVYNMTGNSVANGNANSTVAIGRELPVGMYVVKTQSETGTKVSKVIKK